MALIRCYYVDGQTMRSDLRIKKGAGINPAPLAINFSLILFFNQPVYNFVVTGRKLYHVQA